MDYVSEVSGDFPTPRNIVRDILGAAEPVREFPPANAASDFSIR